MQNSAANLAGIERRISIDGLPGVPCYNALKELDVFELPEPACTKILQMDARQAKKERRNRKAGGRLAFSECAKKFCCTNSFFVIY